MDYFVWSVNPVLFSLGSINIRWYGVLFSFGFVFGYYTMRWIYIREHKNINELDKLLWYLIAGTLIGARLVHVLFYEPGYYFSNPLKTLALWEGGLASHGGAIGIMFSIYLYQRNSNESYLWLLDRLSIPIAFTAFSIRLGNFFNSEILGIPGSVPWLIIFKKYDLIPRHPAQLYEALSYLLIFIVLLYFYKKHNLQRKQGVIFGSLLFFVFLSRFLIEFVKLKQESYDMALMLNTGQLLSIPFMIIGLVLLNFSFKKETNAKL
ncbi:MAG: prolipoprotein diacylglyceryl transferase [Gammaproteobacteria bacterium]